MFSKKNAFIGWLVLTVAKPLAKRKARRASGMSKKRSGAIAATAAGVGAAVGGAMFWRKRRGQSDTPGT
jgi:hypothetical protein